MAYPRQLNLDTDTEEKLKNLLSQELSDHFMERADMVQELMNWQRDYWVKPSVEVREFPFRGASNIIIPLDAIAVESIHANAMMKLFAVSPFLSIKARAGFNLQDRIGFDLTDIEQPLEKYLHYEIMDQMDAEPQINSMLLEQEKYGTGIGKSGYERIVRKAVRLVGSQEQEFMVETKNGGTLDAVPNANFLMRFHEIDPQTATWVGEQHTWTPFQVRQFEQSGLLRKNIVRDLQQWMASQSSTTDISGAREFSDAQKGLEKRTPVLPIALDFQEIWLGFNVDGDDKDEEIQVIYHHDSGIFASIRFNWHSDLHRPYRIAPYIPVEHRWPGLGICKQNEQFQREITTIHRQRLDNSTLANMRMFKVHKLSGYGPNEPIFPGKMWFLDDMDMIEPFQISEVYPSSFANEQATLIYSQQRVGVSELTLGLPQAGTPGTATSDLARIQEGQRKFDFTFRNAKKLIGKLSFDVLVNISQFGTKNASWFEFVEGGDKVRQLLTLDTKLLRDGLLLEVFASGSQHNRLIDRQDWNQIAALLNQYYTALVTIAQLTGDQDLLQLVVTKALQASTEAMKQILETFDIRNIDRLVVNELLEAMKNGAAPTGASTNRPGLLSGAGGAGGDQGNGSAPGLDGIFQTLSALGGGG